MAGKRLPDLSAERILREVLAVGSALAAGQAVAKRAREHERLRDARVRRGEDPCVRGVQDDSVEALRLVACRALLADSCAENRVVRGRRTPVRQQIKVTDISRRTRPVTSNKLTGD